MKTYIHDMLVQYEKARPIRLHMPGHKGKIDKFYSHDITELSFSDNLRKPSGVIALSEREYAKELDTKYCHYLVNGATAGLFALAYCSSGKVLIEGNCHISLRNALALANKEIIELPVKRENDMPQPVKLVDIAAKIEADSSIGTVILTSPNYYGMCADLKGIYKYLRSRKVLFFVDSAHGAHFGLSKLLPPNACEFSDASVQSTHKTLGSLTQTAVLLVEDAKLSHAMKEYINLFTTTSPSYLLLESIELAMAKACDAKKEFQSLYQEVIRFKSNCRELGWQVVNTDDFTRLVIDCSSKNFNAHTIYSCLEKEGIYCEYADDRYIIAILSLYDNGIALDALYSALKLIKVEQTQATKQQQYVDQCFNQAKVK